MTKTEHIYKVITDFISLHSFDDSTDRGRFNTIYSILGEYIRDFVGTLGIRIETSTTSITIGSHATIDMLTAKVFKRLYYQRYCELHGKISTTTEFLGQCIKDFLKSNCYVYNPDGTLTQGYDRRFDIVRFNDYSIDFIDSRLWNWYIVKRFINANEFVKYLERRNVIGTLFYTFFTSIEKDKPQSSIPSVGDGVGYKISKISSVFAAKYNQRVLSDSISAYLTSWFYYGNNSKVYFCDEHGGRLRTFSKYVERYYPNGVTSQSDYNDFICSGFNINNNSYDIKNDKLTKDINYSTDSSTYDLFTMTNEGILSSFNMSLSSNSKNYEAFGTVPTDTVTYYGFVKNSKTDCGNEAFIFGNVSSVCTFCYWALSSSASLYNDFLDFMKERHDRKSVRADATCGPFSGFIDAVYEKVSGM